MSSIRGDTAMLLLHGNPSCPRRLEDAIYKLGSILDVETVGSISAFLPNRSSREIDTRR